MTRNRVWLVVIACAGLSQLGNFCTGTAGGGFSDFGSFGGVAHASGPRPTDSPKTVPRGEPIQAKDIAEPVDIGSAATDGPTPVEIGPNPELIAPPISQPPPRGSPRI